MARQVRQDGLKNQSPSGQGRAYEGRVWYIFRTDKVLFYCISSYNFSQQMIQYGSCNYCSVGPAPT